MAGISASSRRLWESSALLTGASLLVAAGNYVFQALMGRMLPIAEFGYLNAALSLAAMLSLGMGAANQAVIHYLARHQAGDDQQRVAELKMATSAFLLRFTVIVSIVALFALYPAATLFKVPRPTVAWLILGVVLVGVWSSLASAWCAGLGQFAFLALLGILGVVIRLLGGGLAGWWPQAESGIVASLLSSLFIVAIVLRRDRAQVRWGGSVKPVMEREFLTYLVAALAVMGGQFLFLQADLLVAQRHFEETIFGEYSAAGLFGRSVIYLAAPVTTVLFTARSGLVRSDAPTRKLLALFVGLLLAGATTVTLGKELLCRLLLGRLESDVIALMPTFAWVMAGIGLLHLTGIYLLASRRLILAILYGLSGVIYAGVIMWHATSPTALINWMGGTAATALTFLAGLTAIAYWRQNKSTPCNHDVLQ